MSTESVRADRAAGESETDEEAETVDRAGVTSAHAAGTRASRADTDQAGTMVTRTDQASTDGTRTDRTGADGTRTERAGPDQAGTDGTRTDRAAPDQAGTDGTGAAGADVDLWHHGDADVRPGELDLAVNVRLPQPPDWLRARLHAALDGLAAYPRQEAAVAAVAARHGRPAGEVLLTNGAAEAFALIARALAPRNAVCVHPSFTAPEAALRDAGHPVRRVVLEPPFALTAADVPDSADLVVLGNPTNPTGLLHPAAVLEKLARPGRVLVVDEAFADAVPGEPASLAARRDLPGLLVVRSLTKSWGLAGLRVGYLLGDPALLARLRRAQPPWPVNSLALAALDACSQPEAVAWTWQHAAVVARWRQALADALDALPGVTVAAGGQAPFLLVRVGADEAGQGGGPASDGRTRSDTGGRTGSQDGDGAGEAGRDGNGRIRSDAGGRADGLAGDGAGEAGRDGGPAADGRTRSDAGGQADSRDGGGGAVRERLRAAGIAVRRGETFPGLGPDWLRLAVVAPEHHARIVEAFARATSPRGSAAAGRPGVSAAGAAASSSPGAHALSPPDSAAPDSAAPGAAAPDSAAPGAAASSGARDGRDMRGAPDARDVRGPRGTLDARATAAANSDASAVGRAGAGEVTLIGAGPGGAGLITMRGWQALHAADVVIADRLADARLTGELRPGVLLIDAGKAPGSQQLRQDEINALLTGHAAAGRRVARLKGGDPFVFGRGGEEAAACAAAGIPCAVIPGLSSSTAGPALGGIPLTHREIAQSFSVVSGHLPPDDPASRVNWAALAAGTDTLVLLMAVRNLAAIAAHLIGLGRPAATPAACAESAGTPAQRLRRCTLGDLAAAPLDPPVRNPAVIIIGPTAAGPGIPA